MCIKLINKNYEKKLLKQFGNCKEYKPFGIRILFITDTHNCLSYDVYQIEQLKSIASGEYGVKIAAIVGATRFNKGDYGLLTQKESLEIAEKMEEADILISHDGAFTTQIKDVIQLGLKGISYYIYKNHVPIHIHGHYHKEVEKELLNGTKSECLYNIKLLTL